MTTPTLVITRGLPGAGKTTRARDWVSQSPRHRFRVNRDDLRAMFHDEEYLHGDDYELAITLAQHAAIEALLRARNDVVCDDTNLRAAHVDTLSRLAERAGAEVEIWDLRDVPVEVCIERDEERAFSGGHYIGEKQIRRMDEDSRLWSRRVVVGGQS